jgi:hypothetical protein
MTEFRNLIGLHVDLVPEQVRLLEQFRIKDWTRFNVAVPVANATTDENKVDPDLLDILYETDADIDGKSLSMASIDDEIDARLNGTDAVIAGVGTGPLRVGFEGIIASAIVW